MAFRDHAVDLDQKLFVVPGLREVVVRAGLESAYRDVNRSVGGQKENWRYLVAVANLCQDFHTGAVWHHQIQQDQIVTAGFELLQAHCAVFSEIYGIVLIREQEFEAFTNIHFVIDDHDPALFRRTDAFYWYLMRNN